MSVTLLTVIRFTIAFTVALATIYHLNKTLFPKKPDSKPVDPPPDPKPLDPPPDTSAAKDANENTKIVAEYAYVKYVVTFISTIFILIGLAVAVTAARRWEVALLLCGTSLLGGGFLGLLFGYPQGAAQQANTQKSSTTATPQPAPAAGAAGAGAGGAGAMPPNSATGAQTTQIPPKTNLVAESAATLGKVITGFTLADAGTIYKQFRHIAHAVSPALSCGSADCNPDTNHILAAVMILYFFASGFLSGLFLPSYFMKGDF